MPTIVKIIREMDSRKEAILEAVVTEYIETGNPVGSLVLVKKYSFPYSTATIRAEMAELERIGFLAQPHTSAGRVPTERGYRYYVNLQKKGARTAFKGGACFKKSGFFRMKEEGSVSWNSKLLPKK